MPSKDAMYDEKVAAAAKAATKANAVEQVGPAGGLKSGVIAGVKPPVIEQVTEPVVEPVAEWVKAGTVQTADGPVDVDANGFAADGSKPVAKVKSKLVSTYTDEATGDIIDVYEDGTEEVRKKGTVKIDAATAAEAAAAKDQLKKHQLLTSYDESSRQTDQSFLLRQQKMLL